MVLYDNDFIAPLLEAEAELSHDMFDDRQHDDDWWEARRPSYVELYRISAELEAQGVRLPGPFTRSYIQLPPARAHEQEQVEHEGRSLVPPHRRWSTRNWKVMAKEAHDAGVWPPEELMRMLKAADEEIFSDDEMESSNYEFQVGDEVEIYTEAGWKEGVIVRRNYIDAKYWPDYQILLVEEDRCNSELDKMCRLLCVEDADDSCLRGHNKNSGPKMTKELCETLINEVLKVLIQAWWIMEGGYQADDIDSGMLDEFELLVGIQADLPSVQWPSHRKSAPCAVSRCRSVLDLNKLSSLNAAEKVSVPHAITSQKGLHGRKFLIRNSARPDTIEKELFCAFCRSPGTDGEMLTRFEKRVRLGDTFAMFVLGWLYEAGGYGISKNPQKAVDLFRHAAKLGSSIGCNALGHCYAYGRCGITKNEKRARELFELTANNATPRVFASSFENIGILEMRNGNADLALRYWRFIAAAGHDGAMKRLSDCYHSGQMSKAVLEDTLRIHQASILERSSECRDRYSSWKAVEAGDDKGLKEVYNQYYFGYINAKELEKAIEDHEKDKEKLRS